MAAILNREATLAVEQHIGRPGSNLAGHIGIYCDAPTCKRAYTFDNWGQHLRMLARNSVNPKR